MEAPYGASKGGSGGVCIPWRSQGKGVGGDAGGAPLPLPPPLHPPIPKKNGEGGDERGEWGKGGGDSVLVCLRQTRDASPPTEGTLKAVWQPPRLWIFFCFRKKKQGTPMFLLLLLSWAVSPPPYTERRTKKPAPLDGGGSQQLTLRGGLPPPAFFASRGRAGEQVLSYIYVYIYNKPSSIDDRLRRGAKRPPPLPPPHSPPPLHPPPPSQ
nr:hypothetical protein [Morchella crassipes]